MKLTLKIIFISLIIICNSISIFALPNYPTKDDSTKQTNIVEENNWLYGELGVMGD